MRPPVLPRGRRGTSLSRMEGARAALEEMQSGLGLPPPHTVTLRCAFPQLLSAHYQPLRLPSYLLSQFPGGHSSPAAVS